MGSDWVAIEAWLRNNAEYDIRVGCYLGAEGGWRASFEKWNTVDGEEEHVDEWGHRVGETREDAISKLAEWVREQV